MCLLETTGSKAVTAGFIPCSRQKSLPRSASGTVQIHPMSSAENAVWVANEWFIAQIAAESKTCQWIRGRQALRIVRDLVILFILLIVTMARLLGPGVEFSL